MKNNFEELKNKCKEAYMNVFMGVVDKSCDSKSLVEKIRTIAGTVFDNAFSLGYDAGYCNGMTDTDSDTDSE